MDKESVLVLCDMDGTLLNFRNTSRYSDYPEKEISRFELVMAEMTGKPPNDVWLTFQKDGMTDRTILMKLFEIHGVPLSRLQEAMDVMNRIFAERMYRDYQLQRLPGVTNLLSFLRAKGVLIGLLTGALRETGNLKLKEADILDYFKVRADSDDPHTDRAQLFNVAIQHAYDLGFTPRLLDGRYANVFYIGDTPNDVISGRKADVPTIIVGTGPWPKEKILEQNPDLFVPDLVQGKEAILKFMSLN